MRRLPRPASLAVTALLLAACLVMGVLSLGVFSGRLQAAPVLTGSMSPDIPPGALIVATSSPTTELGVGDVIVFHAPTSARPVTVHRVATLRSTDDGVEVTTKGDANEEADRWGAFAITDRRVWTVARVVPGLGRAVLAIRSPAAQFLALIVLAVSAGWLFTEERHQTGRARRPGRRPSYLPGARPTLPPGRPRATSADGRAATVPASARVELDRQGRPVGLWFRLETAIVNAGGPPVAVRDEAPRHSSEPRHGVTPTRPPRRVASMGIGAVVVMSLVLGATAASATFRSGVADDLTIVSTSSLLPPTRLGARVAFALGACTVQLAWLRTASDPATGYDILRQPLEPAPLTDVLAPGVLQPAGPFEVVGQVDGRDVQEAFDTLPGDIVQANRGFRYVLVSTRDAWTSAPSETVDVTALGACAKAPGPAGVPT